MFYRNFDRKSAKSSKFVINIGLPNISATPLGPDEDQ